MKVLTLIVTIAVAVMFAGTAMAVNPGKTVEFPDGAMGKVVFDGKVHADKGYDFPRCRRFLSRRGIRVRIARRNVESSQRLGRHRWVVERSLAWLARYRKLTIRYERKPIG